jgi:exodeoxyribonuclease-3
MRLYSWNVNGLRACAKNGFFDWLGGCGGDLVGLQETKAEPGQLDASFLAPEGYRSVFASAQKKGYSGVAAYYRQEPLEVRLAGDPQFDSEGRWLELHYPSLVFITAYFPNSQEGGKRLDYKLAFCDFALQRCQELRAGGKTLALCGDYNIAHRPIDLARPKENEESPGYLPEERAWMDRFTDAGFLDSFRVFQPGPEHYSWWSYRAQARVRNVGWRIDLVCTNPEARPRLRAAGIQSQVLGSDHCPVWLELD